MNYLHSILEHKRREVAGRKKELSLERLVEMPGYAVPRRSLRKSLEGKRIAVIAEIKKASPSQNVIREDFEPVSIAEGYALGGASALSVLTDHSYFRGKIEYVSQVKRAVSLPVLRKDFIVDPFQLYESRAFGADAVLLIAAAHEPPELFKLSQLAEEIGLEVLLEVHDEREIASLDGQKFPLIGINNRDLHTFKTDLGVSLRLRELLPKEAIVVSESGIQGAEDVRHLMAHGVDAVLIGEIFMRAPDPGGAVRELLRQVEDHAA